MTVEVWQSKESISVFGKGDKMAKKLLKYETKPKKIREIKGRTWNECMKKHHKLMGWEPYKPF